MGLYYKTFWIFNLQNIDKFRSKLVYSSSDKYTILYKKLLAHYGVRKLQIRNDL